MRFISGGMDGLLKYWTFNEQAHKFVSEVIDSRKEYIRDAVCAQVNCTGVEGTENGQELVAVTSDTEGVKILQKHEGSWSQLVTNPKEILATKVSWGVDTNDLSVILKDGSSRVLEECEPGVWEAVDMSVGS